MKRKAGLPITSYFTKRANHPASQESETSDSTSIVIATTTISVDANYEDMPTSSECIENDNT